MAPVLELPEVPWGSRFGLPTLAEAAAVAGPETRRALANNGVALVAVDEVGSKTALADQRGGGREDRSR